MEVIIKESGKKTGLWIKEGGVDYFAEFADVANLEKTNGWEMDEDTGIYTIPEEEYRWWEHACRMQEAIQEINLPELKAELYEYLSDKTNYENLTLEYIRIQEEIAEVKEFAEQEGISEVKVYKSLANNHITSTSKMGTDTIELLGNGDLSDLDDSYAILDYALFDAEDQGRHLYNNASYTPEPNSQVIVVLAGVKNENNLDMELLEDQLEGYHFESYKIYVEKFDLESRDNGRSRLKEAEFWLDSQFAFERLTGDQALKDFLQEPQHDGIIDGKPIPDAVALYKKVNKALNLTERNNSDEDAPEELMTAYLEEIRCTKGIPMSSYTDHELLGEAVAWMIEEGGLRESGYSVMHNVSYKDRPNYLDDEIDGVNEISVPLFKEVVRRGLLQQSQEAQSGLPKMPDVSKLGSGFSM